MVWVGGAQAHGLDSLISVNVFRAREEDSYPWGAVALTVDGQIFAAFLTVKF